MLYSIYHKSVIPECNCLPTSSDVEYELLSTCPFKMRSKWVNSGEHGGQNKGPRLPINLLENLLFRNSNSLSKVKMCSILFEQWLTMFIERFIIFSDSFYHLQLKITSILNYTRTLWALCLHFWPKYIRSVGEICSWIFNLNLNRNFEFEFEFEFEFCLSCMRS